MEQHEPLATKPSSSTIGGISSPVIDRKQSSGDSDMERHLAAGIAKHSPQGEPPSHVLVAKYTCVYRLFGWLFWGTLLFISNFIFLYYSLNRFAVSDAAWFATVVVCVFLLSVFYLTHIFFECLANRVLTPEQAHNLA